MARSYGFWAPDPYRKHDLRYWDGDRWTGQVADGTPRVPTGKCDVLPPASVSPPDPMWPFPEAAARVPRTRREAREALRSGPACRHRHVGLGPARPVGPAQGSRTGPDATGTPDGARTPKGTNRSLSAAVKAAAISGAGAVVVLSGVVSGLWTPWDQGPTAPGAPGGASAGRENSSEGTGGSGQVGPVGGDGGEGSGADPRRTAVEQASELTDGRGGDTRARSESAAGSSSGARTPGSTPEGTQTPTGSVSGSGEPPTEPLPEVSPSGTGDPNDDPQIPASAPATEEPPTEPLPTVQSEVLTTS